MIFVCVPTPLNQLTNRLNIQVVESILEEFERLAYTLSKKLLVAIKSTVPVGTTKQFTFDYPRLCLAYCPEFLRQNSADEDAKHPDRIIVGADNQRAKDVLLKLFFPFDCPIYLVDSKTAELAKLLSNAYLSTKVAFSQQIKKAVEKYKLGCFPTELLTSDSRIADSHLDSNRGRIPVNSVCLPKDLRELCTALMPNCFFETVYGAAVE